MPRPDLTAILDLPIEARLEIVAVICDSIVEEARVGELTAGQLADLERRLADADAHPESGEPWDRVRERILSSLRR
ncbi:MAG TPA: addiction module protein [Myxococcota bacterium]|nr:addiction module protein [Myxococcota bacterium]